MVTSPDLHCMQLYTPYQGSDLPSAGVWPGLGCDCQGGGNAGVCAAISAAERDCTVLVIEAAPADMRGGNTRHTRNLRAMHDAPTMCLLIAIVSKNIGMI